MSKQPAKKCGTCKFLRPRSDGKPFYRDHSYKCLWVPPPIVWPSSVRLDGYGSLERKLASPGSYMRPADGKDCPCWEPVAL